MPAQPRAVPKEERLFSLVLALVASPEGVTKGVLQASVHGYAERSRQGVSAAALDRQFERDKEELRGLGIRIETLDSPLEPGNNQLTRYRIKREQLELPRDLHFSERELMLLRLAALAWREGSLGAEARRAAMKLESLGAGLDVRQLGIAPALGTHDPAAGPLRQALEAGVSVRFEYRVPGYEAPSSRHVAPLRLHRADARWHLVAWDLDRDAGRVFLLSRICGSVAATRAPFDSALHERADALLAELDRLRESQRSVLEVASGSVAEARLAPRSCATAEAAGGFVSLDIGTLDYAELAEELVSYGDEVRVRDPESLREAVASGLREIAGAHA